MFVCFVLFSVHLLLVLLASTVDCLNEDEQQTLLENEIAQLDELLEIEPDCKCLSLILLNGIAGYLLMNPCVFVCVVCIHCNRWLAQ